MTNIFHLPARKLNYSRLILGEVDMDKSKRCYGQNIYTIISIRKTTFLLRTSTNETSSMEYRKWGC